MEAFLLTLLALLFPFTGVVIVLYLRSTFVLLDLVRQDEPLWKSLGEPQKVRTRGPKGGITTIQPIGRWLAWVWTAKSSGANADLAIRLKTTSRLLKIGLALFVLTSATIAMLSLTTQ